MSIDFVTACLKSNHEVCCVKIAILVPVAFAEIRIVGDSVLIFPRFENHDQIGRVEGAIAIGIPRSKRYGG